MTSINISIEVPRCPQVHWHSSCCLRSPRVKSRHRLCRQWERECLSVSPELITELSLQKALSLSLFQHSALILIARVLITRRLALSAPLVASSQASAQLSQSTPRTSGSCNSKWSNVSTFIHYSDRLPDLQLEKMYGMANGCFSTWETLWSVRPTFY